MGPIDAKQDFDNTKTKKKELFSELDSQTLQDTGDPLPAPFNHQMETKFGADLSDVRVHSGKNPVRMSGLLGAPAFPHNDHIVFVAGSYDPASPVGQRLLAHELSRFLQQRNGSQGGSRN